MGKISHRDVMQISATPAQVLEYIVTPERIAEYFPSFIDCGYFDSGQAFWCSGKSGVSLFELIHDECSESKLTLNIISANKVKLPYTIEAIKSSPLMSMVEDWEVKAKDGGTELTKTWRDVVMHKMKFLPIHFIIRRTAKIEHSHLVEAWSKAAAL